MLIQAAVLRDPAEPFKLEEVHLGAPQDGQIRVRICGSGFCHTDTMPRHQALTPLPIVLGHEGSGVVEEVTPSATGVDVGDHVVLSFDSCGLCENCISGHPGYCANFLARNLFGRAGGTGPITDSNGQPISSRWFGQSSFASHVIVDARNVVVVDRHLPIELLGPLGCGVQTGAGSILNVLKVQAGTAVAVYGAGAVGLSAVMAARVAGATQVIAVDVHHQRLELALELGATDVIDGATAGLSSQVRRISKGGVESALDTTGNPAVIASAVDGLRARGTLGLVGAGSADITLGAAALSTGKNLMGILEGDAVPRVFVKRLIALWEQGRFPFDRLIQIYPLADINIAERDSATGATIKPVLVPSSPDTESHS